MADEEIIDVEVETLPAVREAAQGPETNERFQSGMLLRGSEPTEQLAHAMVPPPIQTSPW